MKKTSALLFISMLLAACSETITVSPYLASDEVKSYSDLPKCSESLNDVTYYVQKENTKYKCSNNNWQNEILVDTSIKKSINSSSGGSSAAGSSNASSSNSKSSSSTASSSSSAKLSSSSVYYTVAVFGKCTKDREGEIKTQNDSTRINYLSDFICEPPYWRRMIAYDYTLEELHKSTAQYGTLIDERDGEEYKTVVIGTTEWMAENLRYKIPNDTMFNGGQNCYRKNPKYCKIGGYYYSYVDKSKACPEGWSLPGVGVITELKKNTTDKSISSQIGWYRNDSARVLDNTNESGFTLLPEVTIMAAGIFATQEGLGYFNLPNDYMYRGQSYSGNGKYEKAYHIRCVRFAQTSSSSIDTKSSSSSTQKSFSSSTKAIASSSSVRQISSSSQTILSSSEVKQDSSSSDVEATSSSDSALQNSSSSAKVASISSSAQQITSSSQTTSSSSEVKQDSSSSSIGEEMTSSSSAQS